jgi:hypothetical protein
VSTTKRGTGGAKPDARGERRRYVDVNATVTVNDKVIAARTRDVSRSGLCIVTDAELPRDTEVKVKLVLSLGADTLSEPLALTGRAVWCAALFGRFQVGVIFTDLDAQRRRYLDLFMRFVDGELIPAGHEDAVARPGDDEKPSPEDKDDPFRP